MSAKISTSGFVTQRMEETKMLISQVRKINEKYSPAILQQSPEDGKWSVAQVLQHLNSYNRYYIRAIQTELDKPALPGPEEQYHSGWLGGYFVGLMEPPAEGKRGGRMKSPKDHQPASLPDPDEEIRKFISGEEKILALLEKSGNINLSRVRVPISLNRFIRLKLGDTFHFLIAHQRRHFMQIQKILHQLNADQHLTYSSQQAH